jgi:CRP/FNR family transcriptional regulator, anaerobic regulatory protein
MYPIKNPSFVNFFSHLLSICPLSDEAISDIESKLFYFSLANRQILISDLAKCPYLYFINKGLARAFFYHNGKEITDWFGMENSVIGPIIRNFPVKETSHQVELLEDSDLVRIAFSDLETLFQKHHDVERLGRLIALQTMLHLQFKIDNLQLLSAKERYNDFLQRYPSLINRASLGYIASYLGMNQVTLSRIRKQR